MQTRHALVEGRSRMTELEQAKRPDHEKAGKKNGEHAARHYYLEGLAAICMPAAT